MPITKSAKKAAKQALKRRDVNVVFKESMKTAIKAVKKAVDTQADNIGELVVHAQKRIDKASKRFIITKQSASRKKSTLMKSMNDVGASIPAGTTKAPAKKAVAKKTTTTKKAPAKKAVAKKTTTKA